MMCRAGCGPMKKYENRSYSTRRHSALGNWTILAEARLGTRISAPEPRASGGLG